MKRGFSDKMVLNFINILFLYLFQVKSVGPKLVPFFKTAAILFVLLASSTLTKDLGGVDILQCG